jgi:hypothetical protein
LRQAQAKRILPEYSHLDVGIDCKIVRDHWCSNMPAHRNDLSASSHPYGRDIFGRQVLTGLTFAETQEFVLLDAMPPNDEFGYLLRWEIDEASFPPNQRRWLELFKKHRTACSRVTGNRE